jgi:hypothetical protein
MEDGKRAASAHDVLDDRFVKSEVPAGNPDLSEPVTSRAEAHSTLDNVRDGEGSVGYRIAAMIAMFLLALVAIVIWYYAH